MFARNEAFSPLTRTICTIATTPMTVAVETNVSWTYFSTGRRSCLPLKRKEKGPQRARTSSSEVQEVEDSENGIRRAAIIAKAMKSEDERKSSATNPDTNRYNAHSA